MRGLFAAAAAASVLAVVCPAGAAPNPVIIGAGSYGQELAQQTKAQYPDVDQVTLFAILPGRGTLAVGSSTARTGEAPSGLAARALSSRRLVAQGAGPVWEVALPLYDMQHHPAGVLDLTLSSGRGQSKPALEQQAMRIGRRLATRISYAANLVQEARMDPDVPLNTYAQHLVDQGLARHSDVLILAIHAATPKNRDPEILASNIGRIGKKADRDDMRVVQGGQTNLEVNKELNRFEVELPLKDVSGVRIGALGVVFPLTPGLNQAAKHAEAIRIRNEISGQILTPGNLVEPYPYDPRWSDHTMAQKLVDATLREHPEIRVLALHVTPPAGGKNIILASNIGRIGKVADSDDMGVVTTGKPTMAVNDQGNRYEVELALDDRGGKPVGAVSVVYAYKAGDNKQALAHRAQSVARELARHIPSAPALFRKED